MTATTGLKALSVKVMQQVQRTGSGAFVVNTTTDENELSNNSATGLFGGDCFIATAAFGSYAHPYLHILRDFRDDILLQTGVGRAFVEAYYRHSPPLANWIARHETARGATQGLLLPVIALAAFVQMPAGYQAGALGLLMLFVMFWVKIGGGAIIRTGIKKAVLASSKFLVSRNKTGGMRLHTLVLALLFSAVLVAPATGWTDTIYFIHSDNLNTPRVMTNQYQQVVWKGRYEPFGKVTEDVNAVENNLRFPGQYEDRETGLHYNYFRDYDPGIGRYVQSDPVGIVRGFNHIYSYAINNPMLYVDPLGLLMCAQNLQVCRFNCRKQPHLVNACNIKCEDKYGALSDCQDQETPKPDDPDDDHDEPPPDDLTPDCTFEKWQAGQCGCE